MSEQRTIEQVSDEYCDCGDNPNGPLRKAAACPTHGNMTSNPLYVWFDPKDALIVREVPTRFRSYVRSEDFERLTAERDEVMNRLSGWSEKLTIVEAERDRLRALLSMARDCLPDGDYSIRRAAVKEIDTALAEAADVPPAFDSSPRGNWEQPSETKGSP